MKKKICGILGFPLKKPRSIPIWKKFIKENKIHATMNEFQIQKKNLNKFLNFIKKDEDFLATAITMPYKTSLFKKVKIKDEHAKFAKSINLIKKIDNKIFGYNTDVFGAHFTISKKIKFFKNICIIGLGGSGNAIFNYLIKKYPNKKYYLISKKIFKKKKRVSIFRKLNHRILEQKMIIINCTPLGSSLKQNLINKTPIPINLFKYINKKSFIFDIIYSPKKTILSGQCKKYNIKFINGLLMNTIQAKKALNIVFNKNLKK